MEMRINLEKLFNSHDNNTTLESPSFELAPSIQSFEQSLTNSFDYKYTLPPIFIDDEPIENNLDQLSQIEHQHQGRSLKSNKTILSYQAKCKLPGQRLYYESQMNELRRIKLQQKALIDSLAEENKHNTFTPVINEKSKQLAQKAKKQPTKNKSHVQLSTQDKILKEELIQCTFQPQLIAKNNDRSRMNREQLFDHLHNEQKMKQMKRKMLESEQNQKQVHKKMSKKQFQQFLQRNEDYKDRVTKKQQLLKNASSNYDLKSGEKLFSPKLHSPKSNQYHSIASFKKIVKAPAAKNETIRNVGIFGKKKIEDCQQLRINQIKQLNYFNKDNFEVVGQEPEDEEDIDSKYKRYEQQYEKKYGNTSNYVSAFEKIKVNQKVGQSHNANDEQKDQDDLNHFDMININLDGLNFEGERSVEKGEREVLQQDEQQNQKNNCVMNILNNLINKH